MRKVQVEFNIQDSGRLIKRCVQQRSVTNFLFWGLRFWTVFEACFFPRMDRSRGLLQSRLSGIRVGPGSAARLIGVTTPQFPEVYKVELTPFLTASYE